MVGVINPNDTQTLHEQVLAAAKADFQVAPGQPIPQEASSTLPNAPAASSQNTSTLPSQHPSSLSTAAIVGIVFGGIALIALVVGILVLLARKARAKLPVARTEHTYNASVANPPVSEWQDMGPWSPVSPLTMREP
jgi:hypothetical protein